MSPELRERMDQMEQRVRHRSAVLFWRSVALQVTLIAAIAGAQWAAITWMMSHWRP